MGRSGSKRSDKHGEHRRHRHRSKKRHQRRHKRGLGSRRHRGGGDNEDRFTVRSKLKDQGLVNDFEIVPNDLSQPEHMRRLGTQNVLDDFGYIDGLHGCESPAPEHRYGPSTPPWNQNGNVSYFDTAEPTTTISNDFRPPVVTATSAETAELQFYECLVYWCHFFGLTPPPNVPLFPKLVRLQMQKDPLIPFVVEFRQKFQNYQIPKIPVPVGQQGSSFCDDDSDTIVAPPQQQRPRVRDWSSWVPPVWDNNADLDVLVIHLEIQDLFDIKLMTFCGML